MRHILTRNLMPTKPAVAASVLLLVVTTLVACPASAAITYSVAPVPVLDSGWSFDGGRLTTDGTIGEISLGNLIDWSMRITSPLGSYDINHRDGFSNAVIFPPSSLALAGSQFVGPGLIATNDHLTFMPGDGGFMELIFSSEDYFAESFSGQLVTFTTGDFARPFFSFDNEPMGPNRGIVGDLGDGQIDNTLPVRSFEISQAIAPSLNSNSRNPNRSFFSGGRGPMLLGTTLAVPEPCSAHALLMIGFCLAARRRKSHFAERGASELD